MLTASETRKSVKQYFLQGGYYGEMLAASETRKSVKQYVYNGARSAYSEFRNPSVELGSRRGTTEWP